MMTTAELIELARQMAGETDSLGRLARILVAELADRRVADLSREEALALRGCSVHCVNEAQLQLATSAIDKMVALAFKCLGTSDKSFFEDDASELREGQSRDYAVGDHHAEEKR